MTALAAIVRDPAVEVFAVVDRAASRSACSSSTSARPPDAEIRFLGLVPELAGKGHGRWLMAQTLALAWRKDVSRVWVHTCTLDHPAALTFYLAQGFTAVTTRDRNLSRPAPHRPSARATLRLMCRLVAGTPAERSPSWR